MKDGIPKGNGESRRVMAFLPETYDEFRLQAQSGNLFMDIFFNAAGWQQQPDFLNKRNLLQDTTAAMYGLDGTAVIDDVFQKILFVLTGKDAIVQVSLTDYAGNAVSGIAINGLVNAAGQNMVTDENGNAVGFASPGDTLTAGYTEDYIDCGTASAKVPGGSGVIEMKMVIPSANSDNYALIEQSTTIIFSPAVRYIDACLVGGGGGGDMGFSGTVGEQVRRTGRGGDGGNIKNVLGFSVESGRQYAISIGIGGVGGKYYGESSGEIRPTNGGDTTAFGYTATGGKAGSDNSYPSGSNGGNGGEPGGIPGNCFINEFNESFRGPLGGGGGGGGSVTIISVGQEGPNGGSPYGGKGGTEYPGNSGMDGIGGTGPGGGGGGGSVANTPYGLGRNGAAGHPGAVSIRWR